MRIASGKVIISTPYNLADFLSHGYRLHVEVHRNKVIAFLVGNYEQLKIGEADLFLHSKKPVMNIRNFIIEVIAPIRGSDIAVVVYVST